MKKMLYLGFLVLLISIISLGCVQINDGLDNNSTKIKGFGKVSSQLELTILLAEKGGLVKKGEEIIYKIMEVGPIHYYQTTGVMSSGEQNAPKYDYSTTNIQIENVDEPDIIKSDGNYLYVISKDNRTRDNLYILRAYPTTEARLVSKTTLNKSVGEISVGEIFVNGNRLIIFSSPKYYCMDYYYGCRGPMKSFAIIYDITDRAMPKLLKEYQYDGAYLDGRMIGNYVYIIMTRPIGMETDFKEFPEMYYFNDGERITTLSQIVAINIENMSEKSKHFLLSSTENIFVSQNNIYLTDTHGDKTEIAKIKIANGTIEPVAIGNVPGYVLNQFSMDEYKGNFRIATTSYPQRWQPETRRVSVSSIEKLPAIWEVNNVYVLDENMKLIGKLEGLAPNEKIYSARFMGERLYLVTFKKIDPLFVIDLKDPTTPKVLGKLKIPGYSDYLHPYDENHLIGIGKETVESEKGNFAWFQGVKVSLFDVTDVENPKEIAKYEIGDRGTDSEALRDHKAILFNKEKRILVLPILLAEIDDKDNNTRASTSTWGDYVWEGAYVLNISVENGISLRGRITHLENDEQFYYRSDNNIRRSGYIENVLYTMSNSMIKFSNLTSLEELKKVKLE